MHILIIPSERYGPPESPLEGIFQQHQAQALVGGGFTIGILSPFDLRSVRSMPREFGKHRVGVRVAEDDGIPVFNYTGWNWLPGVPGGHRIVSVRAGRALFRRYLAARGRPDLIHAHNAQYAGMLAATLKEEYAIPYVITEHSSAYARGQIPGSHLPHIRKAFRNASRRLVVSPELGRVLQQIVGEAVLPWEWVPNILQRDFENQQPPKPRPAGRKQFRFLNVGALTDVKGQADLLAAFARSFANDREVELRIAGEGPLRKNLQTLAQSLSIAREVTFLGELTHREVLAEMQGCDAYAHSSHYETFGVVLIEALSCGRPVVATRCGGPDSIVTSDNGLLANPRDIASLGGAMASVRENIASYDAERIRRDCIARFGSAAIVSRLSGIYGAVTTEVGPTI